MNPLGLNTYDEKAVITDIEVINHEGSHWIKGSNIGLWASDVRLGNVLEINVFINREEAK